MVHPRARRLTQTRNRRSAWFRRRRRVADRTLPQAARQGSRATDPQRARPPVAVGYAPPPADVGRVRRFGVLPDCRARVWLARPFRGLLNRDGYPAGTAHMSGHALAPGWLVGTGLAGKRATLDRLAEQHPNRRWVLVGDDAGHDRQLFHRLRSAPPGPGDSDRVASGRRRASTASRGCHRGGCAERRGDTA